MTNGATLIHFREIPLKWMQIKFQNRLLYIALHLFFFESKKIGNRNFLEFSGRKTETQVMPLGHFWSDSYTKVYLVYCSLLSFA